MVKKRKTKTSIGITKETKIITIKTQILEKIFKSTQRCCKPISNTNEKIITLTRYSMERSSKQGRAIKSKKVKMQTL